MRCFIEEAVTTPAQLLRRQRSAGADGLRTFLLCVIPHWTDAGGNYDPTGHLRREIDSLGQVRAFGYNDLSRPV